MRDRVALSPHPIARPSLSHRTALGCGLLGALLLGGCSGGGTTSASGTSASFAVVRTLPVNRGTVFLNDPIRIDFTTPVQFASANLNTITFQVFDGAGNALPEQETLSPWRASRRRCQQLLRDRGLATLLA